MRTANLIGAITANVYMLLVIAVFIASSPPGMIGSKRSKMFYPVS